MREGAVRDFVVWSSGVIKNRLYVAEKGTRQTAWPHGEGPSRPRSVQWPGLCLRNMASVVPLGFQGGQTETISVGSLREVEGRSAKDSIQPSRISIGDPFERGLAERPPEGMDERERRQDR